MGVMSDLSGNSPGVEKVDIDQRKFLDMDMDNIDNRMAAIFYLDLIAVVQNRADVVPACGDFRERAQRI